MEMEEVNTPLTLSPGDLSQLQSYKDELIGNPDVKRKYFIEGLHNK